MDSKLLLVKSIMLLYRESQLENNKSNSADLVREVIEHIKPADTAVQIGNQKETIAALRETALYMAEEPAGHVFDRDIIIQRLRVNIDQDDILFTAVLDGMRDIESNEKLLHTVNDHRKALTNYLLRIKVRDAVKTHSQKILFTEADGDPRRQAAQMIEELEPFASGKGADETGLVTELDLQDTDKVAEVIQEGKESNSVEGIMRTGWQGLNRMMGDYGGFRRGDMVLVGALQHNFKSGMLINIPKHVALYNKPYMLDPKKKPLIIYVSLENKIQDNILILYKNLKENETGEACSVDSIVQVKPGEEDKPLAPGAISITDAAKYIQSRLGVNGYHFKMLRYDPTQFTYRQMVQLLDRYEAEGYEVHMLSVDYLNMMSKEGCTNVGNEAHRIRDLFRRLRNYTNPRHITLLTAHQLSTDAKYLVRNGTEDFVKEVANKGYYDGCKGVDQEVDVEITIHIEKPGDGFSYLTMMRGKHRKSGAITPDRDLYCVYRFEPVGDIPDDLEGKDLSRRHVGGASMSSGNAEQAPWWDNKAA